MQNVMIFMFCPQFLQNLFLSCWPPFPTPLFSHLLRMFWASSTRAIKFIYLLNNLATVETASSFYEWHTY